MCSWRSNSFKKGENSRTKKWSWKKIIQLWNTLGSGKGVPKGSLRKEWGELTEVPGYQRLPVAPAAIMPCLQPFPQQMFVSGEHGCKTSKHFRTFCLEQGLKPRSLFIYWFLTQQHRVLCVCPSPFPHFHLLLLFPTFIFFSRKVRVMV